MLNTFIWHFRLNNLITKIEVIQWKSCVLNTAEYFLQVQGCHGQGKVREKQKFFKVREFCKRSGKILVLVKVSEKSGNFVWFVGEVKCLAFKILMVCKRSWSKCNSGCVLFDNSPNAKSVKIVLRSVKSQGKVREFFMF